MNLSKPNPRVDLVALWAARIPAEKPSRRVWWWLLAWGLLMLFLVTR